MFELPSCSSHGWITNLQHCDWLIRYVRDEEGLQSCIKLNKNIDDELYRISNDIPNQSLLITAPKIKS